MSYLPYLPLPITRQPYSPVVPFIPQRPSVYSPSIYSRPMFYRLIKPLVNISIPKENFEEKMTECYHDYVKPSLQDVGDVAEMVVTDDTYNYRYSVTPIIRDGRETVRITLVGKDPIPSSSSSSTIMVAGAYTSDYYNTTYPIFEVKLGNQSAIEARGKKKQLVTALKTFFGVDKIKIIIFSIKQDLTSSVGVVKFTILGHNKMSLLNAKTLTLLKFLFNASGLRASSINVGEVSLMNLLDKLRNSQESSMPYPAHIVETYLLENHKLSVTNFAFEAFKRNLINQDEYVNILSSAGERVPSNVSLDRLKSSGDIATLQEEVRQVNVMPSSVVVAVKALRKPAPLKIEEDSEDESVSSRAIPSVPTTPRLPRIPKSTYVAPSLPSPPSTPRPSRLNLESKRSSLQAVGNLQFSLSPITPLSPVSDQIALSIPETGKQSGGSDVLSRLRIPEPLSI